MPTVHARAFAKAAYTLGGVKQLSDHLKVSRAVLMRRILGNEKPTTKAYLDVKDLLSEQDLPVLKTSQGPRKPPAIK